MRKQIHTVNQKQIEVQLELHIDRFPVAQGWEVGSRPGGSFQGSAGTAWLLWSWPNSVGWKIQWSFRL